MGDFLILLQRETEALEKEREKRDSQPHRTEWMFTCQVKLFWHKSWRIGAVCVALPDRAGPAKANLGYCYHKGNDY